MHTNIGAGRGRLTQTSAISTETQLITHTTSTNTIRGVCGPQSRHSATLAKSALSANSTVPSVVISAAGLAQDRVAGHAWLGGGVDIGGQMACVEQYSLLLFMLDQHMSCRLLHVLTMTQSKH